MTDRDSKKGNKKPALPAGRLLFCLFIYASLSSFINKSACCFVLMIWCNEDGPADFTSAFTVLAFALLASFSILLANFSFIRYDLK